MLLWARLLCDFTKNSGWGKKNLIFKNMYPLIPRSKSIGPEQQVVYKEMTKSWRAETLINRNTVVRPNLSPYSSRWIVSKKRKTLQKRKREPYRIYIRKRFLVFYFQKRKPCHIKLKIVFHFKLIQRIVPCSNT